MVTREQREKLFKMGLNLIPARGKYPALKTWKEYQDKEYDGDYNENENLAVLCGFSSNNLIVLDLDSADLYQYFNDYNTFTVKTGKGYHLYFRHVGDTLQRTTRAIHPTTEKKIDIQSQGAYVISPYSIHDETKKPYEIVKDVPILELDFHEVTGRLEDLGFVNEHRKISDILENGAIEGERDNSLFRLACSIRWFFNPTYDELLYMLNDFNKKKIHPPLTESEVEMKCESAMKYFVERGKFEHIIDSVEDEKSLIFDDEIWNKIEQICKSEDITMDKITLECKMCKTNFKPDYFEKTHEGHPVIVKY